MLFHNKLAAAAFEPSSARSAASSAKFYYLLLLCLTSLAVVFLVRVVGSFMVVALLALPAAIAGRFVRHLWQMMRRRGGSLCGVRSRGLAVSYPYGPEDRPDDHRPQPWPPTCSPRRSAGPSAGGRSRSLYAQGNVASLGPRTQQMGDEDRCKHEGTSTSRVSLTSIGYSPLRHELIICW